MSRFKTIPGARVAVGRSAEEVASVYLAAEGFRLLWKNARIGPLEIDLVMKKSDLVILVEVRSRWADALEGPLASIAYGKRRMLLRAARGIWRGRLKRMPDVARVRIDVVAITWRGNHMQPRIEWIRGALTENDG